MFLLFMISLSILLSCICMELDRPPSPRIPLSGECPGCRETVVSGWLVCPQCTVVLREVCQGCGRVHDTWVNYCPWCGDVNDREEGMGRT